MIPASKEAIVDAATAAIFGKPLVVNVHRSILVEAMVAAALPDWEWCSTDYAAFDFWKGGVRLEVKQTALRQTWSKGSLSRPTWDIAPRTGYWQNGSMWVPEQGRNADIYILALHDVVDDTADHRDPAQWSFFVIPAERLPAQKCIGATSVAAIARPLGLTGLAVAIERCVTAVRRKHANPTK